MRSAQARFRGRHGVKRLHQFGIEGGAQADGLGKLVPPMAA